MWLKVLHPSSVAFTIFNLSVYSSNKNIPQSGELSELVGQTLILTIMLLWGFSGRPHHMTTAPDLNLPKNYYPIHALKS